MASAWTHGDHPGVDQGEGPRQEAEVEEECCSEEEQVEEEQQAGEDKVDQKAEADRDTDQENSDQEGAHHQAEFWASAGTYPTRKSIDVDQQRRGQELKDYWRLNKPAGHTCRVRRSNVCDSGGEQVGHFGPLRQPESLSALQWHNFLRKLKKYFIQMRQYDKR
jgi:hypothetical protein